MKGNELTGCILFSRYLVGSCIGFGSFGKVYLAYDTEREEILAMKTEQDITKNPQLINESRILKLLNGEKGFATFHCFGYEAKCNILAMELLGPSLEDLFNICSRKFSLKTILLLADQIIARLQVFHSKNYVYRDIKPENFLMGLHENSHVVYLVDFGLSKKYRDSKTHQHIPYKEGKSVTGTVRYSSINTLMGIEYSRRDDLEAVGYMLQYFFMGGLQWQGIKVENNTEKYQKILEKKLTISTETQCIDMPVEFSTYMNYCKALKFSERPDYSFLRRLFLELFQKLQYSKNYDYDWCCLEQNIKYENGTLNLKIYNGEKEVDGLQLESIKQIADFVKQEQIELQIEEKASQKQEQEQRKWEESMGNIEEGNIGSQLLEDSDLKLISNRNPWYESQY